MTGRLNTSLITSSQPLMLLLAVFVYDPLTRIVSLFLAAGCRAFYHAGLTFWNSLPEKLRNSDSFGGFKRFTKTVFFQPLIV